MVVNSSWFYLLKLAVEVDLKEKRGQLSNLLVFVLSPVAVAPSCMAVSLVYVTRGHIAFLRTHQS